MYTEVAKCYFIIISDINFKLEPPIFSPWKMFYYTSSGFPVARISAVKDRKIIGP